MKEKKCNKKVYILVLGTMKEKKSTGSIQSRHQNNNREQNEKNRYLVVIKIITGKKKNIKRYCSHNGNDREESLKEADVSATSAIEKKKLKMRSGKQYLNEAINKFYFQMFINYYMAQVHITTPPVNGTLHHFQTG